MEEKEPKKELSRGHAFALEKYLYHDKEGETWSVFGNVTNFRYKEGIGSLEDAQKYVDELNANLKNV